MIRVVLVDDQPIVRAGVGRILGHEDGFEIVAECGDGREALTAVSEHRPDVVLMDIRMPVMDGVEATREISRLADPPPVLVLTTFDEDDVLWGAIEAGVSGFLLKDASADDLIAATSAVAAGGAWFDRSVAPRVLEAYRGRVAPANRERQRLEQLTERENAVLRLMARGAANQEISQALHVSEATVKSHIGAIFAKLGVRDRAAAIVFAFDHGVVAIGEDPREH
ncbi:response regulator transcription factor [Ornithinimicrobium faecis]|uniref:response regulator transcription factor n=1 Tax=Ornithinimicrobium faecis TaxID=2934158 RepID=UPI002117F1AC|nr:response regulator transcription factor [Ornithinimicrobium sp. HY1745]